jgi:electron-transferring-flavoprotein dehydrogenase
MSDMRRTRNMRLAFKDGFYLGGFKAGLMTVTGGALFGGKIDMPEDAAHAKESVEPGTPAFVPDNVLTFSKVDAVFKSGNATRDTIPAHLIVSKDVTPEVAEFYSHVCPAGVYERGADGTLVVNPPNCVDCKATDVLGPRWTPREGGERPQVPSDVAAHRGKHEGRPGNPGPPFVFVRRDYSISVNDSTV